MLLATGIVCWIAYQSLINVGGVTRSIPLTGIPMPFLSYGGSALASLLAGVGILLSISRRVSEPAGVEQPERRQVRAVAPRGVR
jgi:cell division protein FtsW